MAAVHNKDVDSALEHITLATSVQPGSLKYSNASKLIQQWSSSELNDLYSTAYELFCNLTQYLTKKPVEVSFKVQHVASPAVVLERYILDGLAYDGPQFEEMFKMGDDENESVLFDKETADLVIGNVKRAMVRQKEEGKRPSVRFCMAGPLAVGSAYSVADMDRLIEMD